MMLCTAVQEYRITWKSFHDRWTWAQSKRVWIGLSTKRTKCGQMIFAKSGQMPWNLTPLVLDELLYWALVPLRGSIALVQKKR